MSVPLTADGIADACGRLARRDPDLRRLLASHGVPPLWLKGPGFETLVDIVLGQQVSLMSAQRALERVRAAAGAVTPEAIASLGEEGLRRAGQTRQKARYVTGLARASLARRLDLGSAADLPDAAVAAALTAHTGVGRWTADIYLVMGLGRPDVWPATDLALVTQARRLPHIEAAASPDEIAEAAQAWQPYRSVAARILWQAYLTERGRPLE